MITEGKVWGRTTLIAETETTSVHSLEILPGGFSSKHRHRIKRNLFFIISGAVKISVWRGKKWPDETILRAGETIEVEPGIWHKFEALEESRLIETYTVHLEHPDIERADTGGIRTMTDRDPNLAQGDIDGSKLRIRAKAINKPEPPPDRFVREGR